MRVRRPIRAAVGPPIDLKLPTTSQCEVQVQNKNTTELTTFFIDGSETLESPMITTGVHRSANGRLGAFSATGPAVMTTTTASCNNHPNAFGTNASHSSHANSSAHPNHSMNPHSRNTGTLPRPSSSVVLNHTTSHSTPVSRHTSMPPSVALGPHAAAPPSTSNPPSSAQSSSNINNAQFFHVDNTNLFVLLDGISMFYEGKSTFTGVIDPAVVQKMVAKFIHVHPTGPTEAHARDAGKDSEKGDVQTQRTPSSHPLTQGTRPSAGAKTVSPQLPSNAFTHVSDTVESAIRDLQSVVSPSMLGRPRDARFPEDAALLQLPTVSPSEALTSGPTGDVLAVKSTDSLCSPTLLSAPASPIEAATQFRSPQSSLTARLQPPKDHHPLPDPTNGHHTTNRSHKSARLVALVAAHPHRPLEYLRLFEHAKKIERPLFRRGLAVKPTSTPLVHAMPAAAPFHGVNSVQSLLSPIAPKLSSSMSLSSSSVVAFGSPLEADGPASPSSASSSSLLYSHAGASRSSQRHAAAATLSKKKKKKDIAVEAIGQKNDSVELEDVTFREVIGSGTQGIVRMVELNKKFYAMKQIDVDAVMATENQEERHIRKRGLIRELEMIRVQKVQKPPQHLIRMFNAVSSSEKGAKRQLYILMELMWLDMEKLSEMVYRLPDQEIYRIAQQTFKESVNGSNEGRNRPSASLKTLQNQLGGSCRHVLGRQSFKVPENWETKIERKSVYPEIILSLLAADVLKGLKELHEDYHVVHCDLKPGNILLSYDREQFKIADFGCSRPLNPDNPDRVLKGSGMEGTKLYKAPERCQTTLDVSALLEEHHVDFGPKSDVWSLGIILLELSGGVHPCHPFKTDYWNYSSSLKLSRMVKPLKWSDGLFDFILRCTYENEKERWSVDQLLEHPFIQRYARVSRKRFANFFDRLEFDSQTFHKKQQRLWLEEQIRLSAMGGSRINYKRRSCDAWRSFTSPIVPGEALPLSDQSIYPALH